VNDHITVVISCFNYGEFLAEAVMSLSRQGGGAPRIVVVDDGSTDPRTQQVLTELDDGVEVVSQENQGASTARNAGLRRVETPYALILDADDRLAPGALRALSRALDARPEIGYAYGQIEFFGARSGVLTMPPFDPWRLMFRHIVGPTALVRQEVIDDTGGFDPTFSHYEDWEIWVHALACDWRGLRVDEPMLEYRQHGRSKFNADRANYREWFGRLRKKHSSLYQDLGRMADLSGISPAERALYRHVWGLRPWPAAVEQALYSLLWRSR
jgi:glycosyltransferase involved in cell wall biosynthesis